MRAKNEKFYIFHFAVVDYFSISIHQLFSDSLHSQFNWRSRKTRLLQQVLQELVLSSLQLQD